jgi:hypothetical protein
VPTRSIYKQTGEAPSSVLELRSGAVLSGHRLVVVESNGNVNYADNLDLTHPGRVLGLTLSAATPGELVSVQRAGRITEPSWQWETSKPLWLGRNGALTQSRPRAGFVLVAGVAIAPNTILMANIQASHITYLFNG